MPRARKHDRAISFNACQLLEKGIIPWDANVPSGLDPLPFYTTSEPHRSVNGFTLNERGNWKRLGYPNIAVCYLLHSNGYAPRPTEPFELNLMLLAWDMEKRHTDLHGLETTAYRAEAWRRAFIQWPRLYGDALREVFTSRERPVKQLLPAVTGNHDRRLLRYPSSPLRAS